MADLGVFPTSQRHANDPRNLGTFRKPWRIVLDEESSTKKEQEKRPVRNLFPGRKIEFLSRLLSLNKTT